MEQYISKSAVVAEIERRINNLNPKRGQGTVVTKILKEQYEDILSFLDTLEVKEVGFDLGDPNGDKSSEYIVDTKTLEVKEIDLEEDVDKILEEYDWDYGKVDCYEFAKHFFELGLKANGD